MADVPDVQREIPGGSLGDPAPTETRVLPLGAEPQSSEVRRRRRRPWLVGVILIAVAAIVVLLVADGGGDGEVASTPTQVGFADVVITDLVEVTTLDGTLGRVAGDPIASSIGGTVTAAPEPGDVVSQGATLFEIDGEPVVLLFGDVPAFRDITLTEDVVTIDARASGTITWLPEVGTTIEQGDILFEVDDEPVVLLLGAIPAFRRMVDLRGENMSGVDVAQLEVALTALGFNEDGDVTVDDEFTDFTEKMVETWQESIGATEDGIVDLGEVVFLSRAVEIVSVDTEVGSSVTAGRTVVTVTGPTPMTGDDVLQLEVALSALGFDDDGALVVDGEFTRETKAAVTAWQEAAGIEPDGVVDLGEVVFLPDSVRIASLLIPSGGRVNQGGAVLNVTSSDIVVIAELSAADQGIVAEGDVVTVELPDNTRTSGTVESVATVATRLPDGTTIFEVTIVLDDPLVAGDLDEAPVDVDIVTDSVTGVAAVPVTALLALREGGYAVEVDLGNGTTGLVPVEPGFFADGLVQVDSNVLEPGMKVVVP